MAGTISFVNKTSFIATSGTSFGGPSTPVSMPPDFQSGDLLIIFALSSYPAGDSITTPSGWTSIGGGGSYGLYIFYKFATGAESTIILTNGMAGQTSIVAACSVCCRNCIAYDASATLKNITSLTSTISSNTLVTTGTNDLIFTVFYTESSGITFTPPAGTLPLTSIQTTNLCCYIYYETQNLPGTSTSRTSTLSSSVNSCRCAAVSFKAGNLNDGSYFFNFF